MRLVRGPTAGQVLVSADLSPVAWLCSWPGFTQVVWARTIEEARLEARKDAGPTVAVGARLATQAEVKEGDRG